MVVICPTCGAQSVAGEQPQCGHFQNPWDAAEIAHAHEALKSQAGAILNYQNHMLGVFASDKLLRRAVELWLDYYRRTEAFDQICCSGRSPRTGHAVPVYAHEMRISSDNARQLMIKIARQRVDENIDDETWERAQEIALREHDV